MRIVVGVEGRKGATSQWLERKEPRVAEIFRTP